ncbi:MAG: rRNA adenine N-6-methyltransferase family protein, partial [Pseudomonadota bacterium]
PAKPAYGRLGVLAAARAIPTALFDVSPAAFVPPPKVWSTVVRLEPRPGAGAVAVKALERVTAAAFGQRRKMLRSSLKVLGDPEALIAEAGLTPTERAERVPVEAFVRLAEIVARRSEGAGDIADEIVEANEPPA